MYGRATIICMFLGAVPIAHATDVVTYGVGLDSCKSYATAREEGTADLVAYTDWLSGYVSGVNTTSNHRNNFLSHEDLKHAMVWVSDYCRAHPSLHLAEAAWVLVLSARTGPAAHSVEVTAYGSGYKSCAVYLQARGEQSIELNVDHTEFIAWLGGYLSGANAISLTTDNTLGKTGLTEAAHWLDGYCEGHAQDSYGAAVQALIAGNHSEASGTQLVSAGTSTVLGSSPGAMASAPTDRPRVQ